MKFLRNAPHDAHTRWGWGPLRGAFAPSGGHFKVFGFTYTWLPRAGYDPSGVWTPSWEFRLFGLFAVKHTPSETKWAFGCPSIGWTRAEWRLSR